MGVWMCGGVECVDVWGCVYVCIIHILIVCTHLGSVLSKALLRSKISMTVFMTFYSEEGGHLCDV